MSSAGTTGALHGTVALSRRFLNSLGGATFLSGSYSNGSARFILPYLFGPDWKLSGWDAATLRHSRMIVLWGANILDTRFGSELPGQLLAAKARGAEIVAIDPRKTSTVERAATRWIPIRPGTDAALMLALLQVMAVEGLVARDFALRHSVGYEELEASVLGRNGEEARSPEWAAPITGVPAEEIRRLAREWAAPGPTMLIPGYSIQRVFAGEEPYRLGPALQLATGNFGRLGGSTGSTPNRLPKPRVGTLPDLERPELPSVPVNDWPEAILQGRAGGFPSDLAAAYVLGANFLNQGADIRKNLRAFERLEFVLCHELFLSPTARAADLVLPAASPFEKEDIGIPWGGNYLVYKPRAFAPAGQARTDYDILRELSERLGAGERFSEGRNEAAWIEHFLDQSEIEDRQAFKSTGFYHGAEEDRVGLADFAADPRAHPLGTPSGLVELRSEALARDTGLPALPAWRRPPQDPRFPLLLVTPKSARRTHSQGGWTELEAEDGEPFAQLHPRDAESRGIREGSRVRLLSAGGSLCLRARLSESLMPGTLAVYEGTWLRGLPGEGDGEGAPNFLTDTRGNPGSRSCVMHAIEVEAELLD